MTKAEAVNTLLQCNWLDSACRNIGGELWQDLKQEFWLHILEKEPARFEIIRSDENSLRYWSAKILISIYLPKTNGKSDKLYRSKFLKQHDREHPSCLDIQYIEDELETKDPTITQRNLESLAVYSDPHGEEIARKKMGHDFWEFSQQKLGALPWYERVLFNLELQGMSYRQIERETTIPRKEISATIDRVKQEIKSKWNILHSQLA